MGCDAVMSKIKFINPTTAAIEALNIEAKSIEALKHTIIKLYSTTNYWLRTTVLLYYYYLQNKWNWKWLYCSSTE